MAPTSCVSIAIRYGPEETIGPAVLGSALRIGVRLEQQRGFEVWADVQVVHLERRVANDISVAVDGSGESASDTGRSVLRGESHIEPVIRDP
eukprot:7391118-Prymnesium_polylepis.1